MARRKNNSSDWVSFGRAFLMTFGLIFLFLPVVIWQKESGHSGDWPGYVWVLLCGLIWFGIALCMVALVASPKTVEKWIGGVLTHEAAILLIVIAAPIYFLLRLLVRRR